VNKEDQLSLALPNPEKRIAKPSPIEPTPSTMAASETSAPLVVSLLQRRNEMAARDDAKHFAAILDLVRHFK